MGMTGDDGAASFAVQCDGAAVHVQVASALYCG